MFARLGRFAYQRRRVIVIVWALVFAAGGVLGTQVFNRTKSDLGGGEGSEAVQADRRLRDSEVRTSDGGGAGPEFAAAVDGRSVDDPALRASIVDVAQRLRALPGVLSVIDVVAVPQARPQLVSADGRTTIVQVTLKGSLPPDQFDAAVRDARSLLKTIDAPNVVIGGAMFIDDEFNEQSEKDLQRAELGSIPVSLIVMVFVFGGLTLSALVAASLPMIMAFFCITTTFLVLLGFTYLTDVSIYAINVATMFGLGLSFDYGLLVVNRFREERGAGHDVQAAVERTTATAGLTIAFSALTVAAALSGMFVFDDDILRSLGMGGVAVVLVGLLAGLTLLPALLAIAGERIKPAKVRSSDHGYFYQLSGLVQKRAVLVVVITSALLVLTAIPFLRVRLEGDDYRALPRGSETRAAYTLLQEKFPGVSDDPIVALFDMRPDDPRNRQVIEALTAMPGVASVRPRQPDAYTQEGAGLTVVEVVARGAANGDDAQRIAKQIRATDFGVRHQVTGEAAGLVDYKKSLASRLPWAFAIIALSTLVLLFLMTGSILVPIKAIIMNVLSLGATFGALVWIFQDGHLSHLLDFESTGALHVVVPVIVFIFAFGLSMDYEVFLLSRIKETHDQGYDNDAAVAVGLQRTGRIITSAALLIVVVFAGFAAGELLFLKQMGVGLALAVIVDATIVRSLLVPATMKLLGERNWWAPRPLRRVYDRFGLHEAPVAALTAPLTTSGSADVRTNDLRPG
ncbi:MAG: MMPL family transporter [Mycobacteriales bacterium]